MKAAALLINKLHAPVTVLGPGRRLGIWLQGCRIRCKGCVSQDTWEFDTSKRMPVADLLAWCAETVKCAAEPITGVTLSGGEPFDQPEGLSALLRGLRRQPATAGLDLLCYSGYPLKTLQAAHADLLGQLDALIPEPYIDALPLEKRWRGSANQTLEILSARGQERYAAAQDAPAGKDMQVAISGRQIWFIGLPDRGDMPALEALCRQRGIDFNDVSWRR
jgi:anaerobic ribonucleoside-triphosphate reductase activating protein